MLIYFPLVVFILGLVNWASNTPSGCNPELLVLRTQPQYLEGIWRVISEVISTWNQQGYKCLAC